jgi:general secretion pathway protein M
MGLQDRIDALQPRERRLLGILVGVFAVICVVLLPVGISAMLADKRSQNEALREAIDRMFAERDEVQQRADEAAKVLNRYKTDTPALAGLLSRHAKELEVEIPEFKERPAVPIGKKYEERSTEINVKKIGMRNLVLFMEKIAKLPHPISITKFTLRKRGAEPDSWDAGLTVSSFHRLASAKDEKKPTEEEKEEEN